MSQCPQCGGTLSDSKEICLKCGRNFDGVSSAEGPPPSAFENSPVYREPPSSDSPSAETREESGAIYELLRGRIFFWIVLMVLCGILSAAALFYSIRQQWVLNERADRAIAERFQDEKIQAAVSSTAERYGQEILKAQVDPVFQDFQKKLADTHRYLDEMKLKLEERYQDLARQSALLEERKMVLKLAEQAMRGYRRSYDQLSAFRDRKEPEGLSKFAAEEMERVDSYFRFANRLEGTTVNFMDENGRGWINERVPTEVLLRELRESPNWRIRAKSAELLHNRMEPGVPEALLEAADTDPYLDIVKWAIESFSAVTGYDGIEVFGVKKARAWWAEYGRKPKQVSSGTVKVTPVQEPPSGWKTPAVSESLEVRHG